MNIYMIIASIFILSQILCFVSLLILISKFNAITIILQKISNTNVQMYSYAQNSFLPLKNCSRCNYELKGSEKYCPKCGQQYKRNCPSCDTLVEIDSNYCAQCKERVHMKKEKEKES